MYLFAFSAQPDPSHPVLSAFHRTCAEDWNAFVATVSEAAERSADKRLTESDAVKMIECAHEHLKRVAEVLRWILRPKRLESERALQSAERFRELGSDWVEAMASRLQKLPQGAPPKKRQSHIDAFEYMLQSKSNSMGKAVRKVCPCGEKRHGAVCHRNLKAGIHELTKTLRKYAPELAAQYELLHPDRAKKRNLPRTP